MLYAIFIIIVFTSVVYFTYKTDKIDTTPVDLTQPVKLKYIKDHDYHDDYEVYFYNPVKKDWWAIPSGYAGIHAPWSFYRQGSYGAYDLERLVVSSENIEGYNQTFKTLADIQRVFDDMNKDYEDFQRREAISDALPNEITN